MDAIRPRTDPDPGEGSSDPPGEACESGTRIRRPPSYDDLVHALCVVAELRPSDGPGRRRALRTIRALAELTGR